MAVSIRIMLFWDVTSCRMVDKSQCSEVYAAYIKPESRLNREAQVHTHRTTSCDVSENPIIMSI
jgi:hypothetical protein